MNPVYRLGSYVFSYKARLFLKDFTGEMNNVSGLSLSMVLTTAPASSHKTKA